MDNEKIGYYMLTQRQKMAIQLGGGREKSAQLMDAHKRLSSHHRHNHDELTIYAINSSSAGIDIVDGGASKTFNNHNVKFDFELQSRLRELGS